MRYRNRNLHGFQPYRVDSERGEYGFHRSQYSRAGPGSRYLYHGPFGTLGLISSGGREILNYRATPSVPWRLDQQKEITHPGGKLPGGQRAEHCELQGVEFGVMDFDRRDQTYERNAHVSGKEHVADDGL
jgi:hypothetical protein